MPAPARSPVPLAVGLQRELADLARGCGGIEALLLTCLGQLICSVEGDSGVLIGVFADGRHEDDVRDLLGPLGRYVPVWLDSQDSPVGEAARQVAEQIAQAAVQADSYLWPAGSYFRYAFDYADARGEPGPAEVVRVTSRSDLTGIRLSVAELPGGLTIEITSDEPGADTPTLASRLGHALTVLASAGPEAVPAHLGLGGTPGLVTTRRRDRRAKPERPASGQAGDRDPAEPAPVTGPVTDWEKRIARIWAEVLETEHISRSSDFFRLGGQSLAAVQVISRLQREYRCEVRVAQLLGNSTLGAFAEIVSQAADRAEVAAPVPAATPAAPAGPAPDSYTYVPSHAQRRLWIVEELAQGDAAAYNVPVLLSVPRHLDWDRFKATWDELARRHDALRTVFRTSTSASGEPLAVVGSQARVGLSLIDLRDQPRQADHRARQLCAEDQRRRFDLRSGPLTRVTLCWLPDGSSLVLVNTHHIITDLWSATILIDELIDGYEGVARDAGARPGYCDYAQWERGLDQDGGWRDHERYLLGELDPPPLPLDLPVDLPRSDGDGQQYPGGELERRLSPGLTARIQDFATRRSATPFIIMLCAYFILLRRVTRADDIVVGVPVANRSRPEFSGVLGFFVSTVFVRINFRSCQNTADLLAAVRAKWLKAYEYQDYPFDLLVSKARLGRHPGRSPIFSTMFAYQDMLWRPGPASQSTAWRPEVLPDQASKYELALAAWLAGDSMTYSFTYATSLFRPETIESLGQRFETCLAYFVEDA